MITVAYVDLFVFVVMFFVMITLLIRGLIKIRTGTSLEYVVKYVIIIIKGSFEVFCFKDPKTIYRGKKNEG